MMSNYKKEILDKIGYTALVYSRINKKLKLQLPNDKIEALIFEIISETAESEFKKIGKNIYITNATRKISLTINESSKRIITADKLKSD